MAEGPDGTPDGVKWFRKSFAILKNGFPRLIAVHICGNASWLSCWTDMCELWQRADQKKKESS